MTTSLGLYDLDGVDLINDLDNAFGFCWNFHLVGPVETVGELYDLYAAHLPPAALQGRCATAMCFFKLRDALEPRLGFKLRPTTPLSAFDALSVREIYRIVERECGFRSFHYAISGLGCLAFFAVPILFLVALWTAENGDGLIALAAIGAMILAGIGYMRAPWHFLAEYETFGDLVCTVTSRNIGNLAGQGARLGPAEAWTALRDIARDHTVIAKELITRDTWLSDPPKKSVA
ncbi:MAG: hypothetical protein H6883_04985 [Rhodobiaceae bacterium]|nr:hypothetical protein [Rhodobiaceae bacterium]